MSNALWEPDSPYRIISLATIALSQREAEDYTPLHFHLALSANAAQNITALNGVYEAIRRSIALDTGDPGAVKIGSYAETLDAAREVLRRAALHELIGTRRLKIVAPIPMAAATSVPRKPMSIVERAHRLSRTRPFPTDDV